MGLVAATGRGVGCGEAECLRSKHPGPTSLFRWLPAYGQLGTFNFRMPTFGLIVATMDASTPQASFLGLPTELRLLIYEYVLEPDTFTFEDPKYGSQDSDSDVGSGSHSQCFQDIRAFNIVLRGSFPGREEDLSNPPSRTQNPWVLGMICRQVRDESAKVLATVSYSDVFFSFYGFTPDDMRSWVQHMGPERVARMRRWAIEGYNWCDSWFFWAEAPEEDPYCEEDHGHRSPHKEQV